MIRKIGVAALLGLLVVVGSVTTAGAQCGTGPMIILNTASFGIEGPAAVTAPYVSTSGNTLTILGLVQAFCSPFLDLNASDPSTEYTLVVSDLVSGGSTHPLTNLWVTAYSGGTFAIYQDSPRNAPTSAAGMPAAGSAAPLYSGGTVILSGTISGFSLNAQVSSGAGSYTANATFTGGTLYARVAGGGSVVFQGALCGTSGCLPAAGGYSAQFDGKFDTPVTATQKSTWGTLKLLYR
ncbi:MAG: hypothetical protein ACRENS_01105 [Candidatus Eiseniibacteriota bacterium]